jgi:hypothetical protein
MKYIMKNSIAILLILLFAACQSQRITNKLNGKWQVESFIIGGEEGIERYKYVEMEYCYEQGIHKTDWIIGDELPETLEGTFDFYSNNDSIRITVIEGSTNTFSLKLAHLSKDNLKLEGNLADESFIIKAKKKH